MRITKARVLKTNINPNAPLSEGTVYLEINKMQIACFVSNWKRGRSFNIGEEVLVELNVNPYRKFTKTEKCQKSITHLTNAPDSHYNICGQVIDMEVGGCEVDDRYYWVDCGVIFKMVMKRRNNIHINDFIEGRVRMDAEKVLFDALECTPFSGHIEQRPK
jgi:hypothetical protein